LLKQYNIHIHTLRPPEAKFAVYLKPLASIDLGPFNLKLTKQLFLPRKTFTKISVNAFSFSS